MASKQRLEYNGIYRPKDVTVTELFYEVIISLLRSFGEETTRKKGAWMIVDTMPLSTKLVIIVLVCVPCFILGAPLPSGTTPNIKQVVKTRCLTYLKEFVNAGVLDHMPAKGKEDQYCTNLWGKFSKAWAKKDACRVTEADYRPFLEASGLSDIKNKILFWSKQSDIRKEVSNKGKNYVVLADTIAGYIVDGLNWCGEVPGSKTPADPDGINYKQCPVCKPKPEHFQTFWGTASKMFAQRAAGTANYLVNGAVGTTPPMSAHHDKSFFAMYELPNIRKNKATSFKIIVANEPGKQVFEKCGTHTILQLQNDIKKILGIQPSCVENPPLVMKVFCANPEHKNKQECKNTPNAARTNDHISMVL